jgi:hypothetical protein
VVLVNVGASRTDVKRNGFREERLVIGDALEASKDFHSVARLAFSFLGAFLFRDDCR